MSDAFTTATADGFTTTDDYFAREYMAFRALMGNKTTTGKQADIAFGAIMLLWLNRPPDSKFSDDFIRTLTTEFQFRRRYCKEEEVD